MCFEGDEDSLLVDIVRGRRGAAIPIECGFAPLALVCWRYYRGNRNTPGSRRNPLAGIVPAAEQLGVQRSPVCAGLSISTMIRCCQLSPMS